MYALVERSTEKEALPRIHTRVANVSVLESTCIATDNACKLVINLIFNTIIYRIYIQYGYL